MSKKSKRIIMLAILALLFWVAYTYTEGGRLFTFENLKENRTVLKNYVNDNFIKTILIYGLIYVVSISFALPGAAILSMAGGFLFGTLYGVAIINVSATLGAAISFLAARYLLGDILQARFSEKLKGFNREVKENGASYFLTVRLIPVFPFFLVNIFAGITKISLWKFVMTTSIGIIPGSFVFAYAGDNLSKVNKASDVFSREILFALFLLGGLSIIPVIYRKTKKKRTG
jgi:uncharacterized membrane protein YdjX (TVP38/TMEM64 family)